MTGLLDTLFLQPLFAIYAFILEDMLAWLDPGPRLVVFALVINLLLVPVYRQTEARSRQLRERRADIAREVARMKRHFKGRELYFYVRAVHRQYGYRPLGELLNSADLALQILVFATVYSFLSTSEVLAGQGFGPIPDLGKPDGLLAGLNLMPVVMTLMNAAAVMAHVGDRARRLQAFALALIFLVLLYASPSGIVVYWTANNAFSLLRSLLQRHGRRWLPPRLSRTWAAFGSQR